MFKYRIGQVVKLNHDTVIVLEAYTRWTSSGEVRGYKVYYSNNVQNHPEGSKDYYIHDVREEKLSKVVD